MTRRQLALSRGLACAADYTLVTDGKDLTPLRKSLAQWITNECAPYSEPEDHYDAPRAPPVGLAAALAHAAWSALTTKELESIRIALVVWTEADVRDDRMTVFPGISQAIPLQRRVHD